MKFNSSINFLVLDSVSVFYFFSFSLHFSGMLGLGLALRPEISALALALQRYKAKAKAKTDTNWATVAQYFSYIGNIYLVIRFTDLPVSIFRDKPILILVVRECFFLPAASAPLERIFSQSGLIMHASNRVRMSDSMLESLVFLRCNSELRN